MVTSSAAKGEKRRRGESISKSSAVKTEKKRRGVNIAR